VTELPWAGDVVTMVATGGIGLRLPEIGSDLSGFLEGLLVFLCQRAGLVGAGIGGSHRTGDAKHG
jgi:hypothetical protein